MTSVGHDGLGGGFDAGFTGRGLPKSWTESSRSSKRNRAFRNAPCGLQTDRSATSARYSVETIFPITSLVLSAVVFFLFGQFWPVIATSGVGIVAILWTLAFTIFFDPEINLMLAMIPAVMMVVSFSDVVHLCLRICSESKCLIKSVPS